LKEFEPYKNDMLLGRVIKVHRDMVECLYLEKIIKTAVSGRFKYTTTGSADYPSVGDYVIFTLSDDIGVIHKVCSRYSELSRQDVGGSSNRQVMASNVDQVFICISLNNDFNLKKINQFIAMVYSSNAVPIVLLTKRDLCSDVESKIELVRQIDEMGIYPISVLYKEDVNILRELVKDKTSVFLGASGVGKSSIVNALMGEDFINTSQYRDPTSQGSTTKTNRELINI